jgi:glucokinase
VPRKARHTKRRRALVRSHPTRPALVLAGDIGGTKTNLGVFQVARGKMVALREATFSSREHAGLEQILRKFLGTDFPSPQPSAAAFAIAGPVIDNAVRTTNLPWHVEGRRLSEAINCPRIRLLNDLEGTAIGALHLSESEIRTLQTGVDRPGHRAVIAAGTGLGQAFLFWDGERHVAAATEGGHVDFGPRDDLETELLHFLIAKFGHVSYERIVSGPGLFNIFDFLSQAKGRPVEARVRDRMKSEVPEVVIGEEGVAESSIICRDAVEMFLSLYGAQAGNLALTVMAIGGVYVGGGVITKLLPRVTPENFLRSFVKKGRYERLLTDIPVRVILNPKAALIGAANAAKELLRS